MLVLTRRIGETVMIGDEVQVTVLGVTGNQIRLGITAPQTVSVHREEIYLKIQEEGMDSPQSTCEVIEDMTHTLYHNK